MKAVEGRKYVCCCILSSKDDYQRIECEHVVVKRNLQCCIVLLMCCVFCAVPVWV